MRDGVQIVMKSGEVHFAAGCASRVLDAVNAGRGSGKLIALERNIIPTGQMFYIDPDEVESIKDNR